MQGLYLDQDGYLTVDIFNPFGFSDETVVIGDEENTELVSLSQLSNSQDSVVL